MPDPCDPKNFRSRAVEWREKAATQPEGCPKRAACLEVAQAYDYLAAVLEQQLATRCAGRLATDQMAPAIPRSLVQGRL